MSAFLSGVAAFLAVWGAVVLLLALVPGARDEEDRNADRTARGIGLLMLITAAALAAAVVAARATP